MRTCGLVPFLLLIITALTGCGSLDQSRMSGHAIVIDDNAHPATRYAATEFQRFFAEATGSALPLVSDDAITDDADGFVFIGESDALTDRGPAAPTEDLGPEDLRIVIDRNHIAIVGGSPRGTIYGVYTYLERHLGVRFLTPEHTHVPEVTSPSPLEPGEYVYRPPLKFRYAYYGSNQKFPEFGVRMRNNALRVPDKLGGQSDWQLINHTVSRWVPVRKYGEDHPEYFAMVHGKRRANMTEDHFGNPERGLRGTQPCMTEPPVRELLIEGAVDWLDKHPDHAVVSVSQNDNGTYCRCSECAAIDQREGSPMGSLLTLVNAAADRVAEEHPGKFVGTLAYQYSRKPPKHLTPRENVAIQLCSIEACQLHAINDPDCPLNTAFREDLAGWSKISEQIYVWNYMVNFRDYLSPLPNLQTIGPNVRYFVKNHARGLFMQGAGGARGTDLQGLRNYVACNLMWDPTRDDQALIDEFIALHYGEAADHVREYLAILEAAATREEIHHHCFGHGGAYGVTRTTVAEAMPVLQAGMDAAESNAVRLRVEKLTVGLHRVMIEPAAAWVRGNLEVVSGDNAWNRVYRVSRPFPAELADDMRPKVARFIALAKKHEVTHFAERADFETGHRLLRGAFELEDDESW